MATRIVKSLLIHFFTPVDDPLRPGEQMMAERQARHGQRVSTDDMGNSPNTVYGLTDYYLRKYDLEGHFFTQAEVDAMNAGVTDSTLPVEGFLTQPRGDVLSTPATPGIGNDPGATPGTSVPHPLSFQEMQVWQIAEWFKRENPEEDTITTIVTRDPTLAPKFVEAIGQVWNGPEEQDDRDYLIAGIAAIVGSGVAPSGSEGVEGTAPPDNPPPVEVEGTPDDQEYPPSEPVYPGEGTPEPEGEPEGETEVDATESAKTYAAEKGIDLSQVTGSGSGGTITKADVQAYES